MFERDKMEMERESISQGYLSFAIKPKTTWGSDQAIQIMLDVL